LKSPIKISKDYLRNRKEAIDQMRYIANFDQEVILLVTLSPDYRVIKKHTIAVGGFSSVEFPIDVLFERVISDRCRFFMIGHNHSNGVGLPSEADIVVLRKIIFVCEIIKIDIMDSVIFPHGKEPLFIRSLFPKIFQHNYTNDFEKALARYIPKKVRDDDS
jgi:DNA repair protein RadC